MPEAQGRKRSYFIIAFEFPPYNGGIANYSHTLAAHLSLKHNPVKVLTMNAEGVNGDYDYELIKPFGRGKLETIRLLRKLISMGYRVYQFFFLYKNIIPLIWQSKEKKIIITSLFFDLSFLSISLFRLFGVKYEIVLHGLDIYELNSKKPISLSKSVLAADKVIVNSLHTMKIARRYFGDRKYSKFPPLLDSDNIDGLPKLERKVIEENLQVQLSQKLIITVCRLVRRKGVDIAIRVAIEFLYEFPEWSYLIVGEGDQEEELRRMVPDNLCDRIIFLGRIDEILKYSLLNWSSVFIMPNREIDKTDVEGFGISFLEASYMKNWVIAGDNGGVKEAVDVTANAFLVDMNDNPEAHVLEILYKVESLVRTDEALNKGRKFVLDNYTLNSQWGF
ncbi:MAG: glycosyltransferase family 4 protein [Cyclobacteriaceae bacterium]